MNQCNDDWENIASLPGHTSWVYGVPIAPDGNTLASVSFNKIFVWNLMAKELTNILEGHAEQIFSLSISPDGKIIASGSLDKTVKIWDLETGKLIKNLAVRKDPIYSVAFSPDGKILATGGGSKYKTEYYKATTIYLWNTLTGELLHILPGHSLRVNKLVFSNDGHILASVGNEGIVKIWNPHTGELLNKLNINAFDIAITPDNKYLVVSGKAGIKIWNLQNEQLVNALSETSDFIRCLAIHPKKTILAAGCHTNIEIWNLTNGQRLKVLNYHNSISLSFSPDGKLLASGDATCFQGGDGVKICRVPNNFEKIPEFDIDLNETNNINIVDIQEKIKDDDCFQADNIKDAREKTLVSIVKRQGQSGFRKILLQAYNGKCCITDCDVEAVLEAAHIIPYQGTDTNHVANGLLLRADIHNLFDLYMISINPETGKVEVSSSLKNSPYWYLNGKNLSVPLELGSQPSKDALNYHYNKFIGKAENFQ
ncbi:HNH endonuclease [Calothrix membranacea FACHB-236]|nr:HNH endonuclease [Calothrix membranacea FACHB-236]